MEITQYVLLAAVIAGVTELINRLRARDYWVALTVATSAVIGLLFGVFEVEGLTEITGLAAGFGASGALSFVGSVGRKSTPAPSEPLERV
jgi:uncharacterized membrane protein HdeD (DUF308 family)